MAKKRSKRKSLILTAAACLVLLLLLAAAVYELLLPAGPVFSDRENRMLAEKPAFSWKAFFDGSFADDLEKYLADRFPGRMGFIDFTRQLRQVGSLATWEDYARVAKSDVADMAVREDLAEELPMVTPRPTRPPRRDAATHRDAGADPYPSAHQGTGGRRILPTGDAPLSA